MDQHDWLAAQFEQHRAHLRAVAYRMLGAVGEVDDAVQEAWLRLSRAQSSDVENLRGWLTTVVARVCLDMLRARKLRREEPLNEPLTGPLANIPFARDPEDEALLADSVGLALLVLLDTLTPAERLAFVLHDMFRMSFDEIGPIVERSPSAARQLASRARRRVRGGATMPRADQAQQPAVVEAFLSALRVATSTDSSPCWAPMWSSGSTLSPPRADRRSSEGPGRGRKARWRSRRRRALRRPALVDGAVGIVLAPQGRLVQALKLSIRGGRIAAVDVVADPPRANGVAIQFGEQQLGECHDLLRAPVTGQSQSPWLIRL